MAFSFKKIYPTPAEFRAICAEKIRGRRGELFEPSVISISLDPLIFLARYSFNPDTPDRAEFILWTPNGFCVLEIEFTERAKQYGIELHCTFLGKVYLPSAMGISIGEFESAFISSMHAYQAIQNNTIQVVVSNLDVANRAQ